MRKLRHEENNNFAKTTASMWEIFSVIRKYFLSICYVLGSVLGARETAVNKTSVCPDGAECEGGRRDNKERKRDNKMSSGSVCYGKNQQARGTCCLGESSGALEKVVEGVFSEKGALQQRSERHGAVRVSKRRE